MKINKELSIFLGICIFVIILIFYFSLLDIEQTYENCLRLESTSYNTEVSVGFGDSTCKIQLNDNTWKSITKGEIDELIGIKNKNECDSKQINNEDKLK